MKAKLAGLAVIAFLVWWAVKEPVTAGHAFHRLGHWLSTIGNHGSNR